MTPELAARANAYYAHPGRACRFDKPTWDERYKGCSVGRCENVQRVKEKPSPRLSRGAGAIVTAQEFKERGQMKALLGANLLYVERFLSAIEHQTGDFTSEQITAEAGLPYNADGSTNNGMVGALMGGAARRGIIEKVGGVNGQRRESHAAMLTVWRRKTVSQ